MQQVVIRQDSERLAWSADRWGCSRLLCSAAGTHSGSVAGTLGRVELLARRQSRRDQRLAHYPGEQRALHGHRSDTRSEFGDLRVPADDRPVALALLPLCR
jgi:hypothetical protein